MPHSLPRRRCLDSKRVGRPSRRPSDGHRSRRGTPVKQQSKGIRRVLALSVTSPSSIFRRCRSDWQNLTIMAGNLAASFKPICARASERRGFSVSIEGRHGSASDVIIARHGCRHNRVAVIGKLKLQFLQMTLEAMCQLLPRISPAILASGDQDISIKPSAEHANFHFGDRFPVGDDAFRKARWRRTN